MQAEKWLLLNKRADFKEIGMKYGIDQVIARIIRNRDVISDAEIDQFLNGTTESLYSPHLLKDADRAAEILAENIKKKERIHVIGDYDIDGIQSSYILYKGIEKAGGVVSVAIPHRMTDGYGINENLIREAADHQVNTIITCDNGISAIEAINYAKDLGMTVIVTDHHEVPYTEMDGVRTYLRSRADAIVNPKQEECQYPFSGICGAVVAWKVVLALYEHMGIDGGMEFLEHAAFATVGDVMDLRDENRIIVKYGIEQMRNSGNTGLRALMAHKNILPENLGAYHIGFVLGPCLNASGRLDTAVRSLELLQCEDPEQAMVHAVELSDLNEERKTITQAGLEEAEKRILSQKLDQDKVMVVYLESLHESLAGIVAGRIREKYQKPVFVLTRGEQGLKGSGRSIEEYSMFEEMSACRELFLKFGGHPMAAGLSMEETNLEEFRRRINEACSLTEEDFIRKVRIDVPMPMAYVTRELIEQLSLLEPFGKGNTKPVFADRNLKMSSFRIFGKNSNVLKLTLEDAEHHRFPVVYFGEAAEMAEYIKNRDQISILYYPDINSYQGKEEIQFIMTGCM